jgi:putative ABC transport system permease protein
MFKATLKGLLSRKLRLVLSAMAVLLGVMFVSGAFVLTDTMSKSFESMFQGINKDIDVQVMGKPKIEGDAGAEAVPVNIRPDVVKRVESVPGVKSARAGVFAEGARIIGKNGKVAFTFSGPQFGAGWTGEDSLVQLRDGRGPESADEIAIDAAAAESTGYKLGDKVNVLTLKPKQSFTLVGIFGYSGGRDSLGGAHVVAFTVPVAQQLMLGEKDVFSEISVIAAEGTSQTKLRDAIRREVGSGFNVRTQKEVNEAQAAGLKVFLNAVNYILLGFAAVALFVGIFLILNTFSMLVAQRSRELALYRAIGASRGQVIGSVLLEATVIGVVASVLGLAAGVGVGTLLAWLWQKLGDIQLDLIIGVPLTAVLAAFGVGLGVTLVAALFPAVRASRIPPVAAMRDAATPDKPLTTITITGSVVFAAGVAALGWGLAGKAGDATLWLILGGVLVAFIGVALLTPIISRPIVSLLGLAFSRSVPGKLGRRNSARNPRRTAVTAGALMVSIALVTGISTVLSSATESFTKTLNEQVKAQLIISGIQSGPIPPTFERAALPKIEQLDGVKAAVGVYFDASLVDGKRSLAFAPTDLPTLSHILGVRPKSGTLGKLGDSDVVVNEDEAKEKSLKVGDTLPVQFSRGEKHTFTVAGIYRKAAALENVNYMFPESAAKDFRINAPAYGYVELDEGASVSAVRSKVDGVLKDSPEVSVQDQSAFIEQQTSFFDYFLIAIQVLLGLAMLIAVLGIVNTLALSVIERTRELGLLRAIGLRRSQMMRMVTVESVVISVFGALLGLVVGVGLGAAVVRALEDEGFTEFAMPWGLMGVYLVASAGVGVIAAILPAVRAARLNVLGAIAYE